MGIEGELVAATLLVLFTTQIQEYNNAYEPAYPN